MIRKALFALLVIALFAPAVAGTSHTDTETAIDTVILASMENYPDALVAGSAAAKIGVPVLLTEEDELAADTQSSLDSLAPSQVVLVGGEQVISADVRSTLAADGYNVTRLWGNTRYGTSVEVAGHFWVEGADEALLVQNSLDDDNGDVLAEAKELARQESMPVYLTPEGSVPAVVQSSLEDLGVGSVTVVGTAVSPDYRSSLQDIGVGIDEEITGDDDDDVEQKIRDRLAGEMNASSRLVVVASEHFRHQIAASHLPNHHVVHVRDTTTIQDVVDTVNGRGVTQVKVAGTPELANQTAVTLRQQTDAEVDLVVAEASAAVRVNANLTASEQPEFARQHEKLKQRWEDRREQHMETVQRRANKTINRADRFIHENTSEEAREQLRKAELLYSKGNYFEAMEAANEASSAARNDGWKEQMAEREEAMREAMDEEMESLKERTDDLRDLNQDFADEMEQNMTVEERLEIVEEFRDERRERVKELVDEASDRAMNRTDDLEKRLRDARNRIRDRSTSQEFRFETECTDESTGNPTVTESRVNGHDGAVSARGTLLLPTPTYRADAAVETSENGTMDMTIEVRSTDGFGIQCVGTADYKYRVDAAPGNWTVNVALVVDGSDVHSATQDVTVTPDDAETTACDAAIKRAQEFADEQDACGMAAQELECPHDDSVTYMARNTCQIGHLKDQGWTDAGDVTDTDMDSLSTTLALASTDSSFYRDGSPVDEVSVPANESVKLTLTAREDGTYSAGAEYNSSHFETGAVQPGGSTTVTFTATEDFTIDSYWPDDGQYKTSVDVDVE